MDVTFDFTGKVAVVTGGSGVLGGAIGRALADSGASVAILALSRMDKAERLAADITADGGKAVAIQADVLSKDSLQAAADRTLEAFGHVDFLVNGAGGAKPEATTSEELSFFDLPEQAVRHVMDLNFLGTFLACQVFGRDMAQRSSGCVLNFSS
ncbi:MAG: SDR family NAD(P)-dependent oxidoreductase, partial [Planctomycetota bacterium]